VTLRSRIHDELTASIRAAEPFRRDVLRMAYNALYNAEKRDRREYSDDEVVAVLTREVKTRRESIELFRKGGREDLATKEEREIEILQEFLPAALPEAELVALVNEALLSTGARSARELGKVMGWLAPRTRGRADGRHVSELVAAALARIDLAEHDATGSAPPRGGA
jgi:hypothetical protein